MTEGVQPEDDDVNPADLIAEMIDRMKSIMAVTIWEDTVDGHYIHPEEDE